MKIKKISGRIEISVFGITVTLEGDFSNEEKDTAAKVLWKLANHAVLYKSTELERAGKVVNSVTALRQWLEDTISPLPARSKLAEPLLGVQKACRDFLVAVDDLNQGIVRQYEAAAAKKAAKAHLYDDDTRLLALVKRRGTPKLLTHEDTSLTEIEPAAFQWKFVETLQQFRSTVGGMVVFLGAIAGEQAIPVERLV